MPIYEYRCTACERVSEEWVRSFDSPEEQSCPHCGKPAKRIMSNTSFQLKGGGWYVTDYGSHKNAPKETGEAAPAEAAKTPESPTASTETSTQPAAMAEASATPATPASPASPATSAATPAAASPPTTPSSAASAA